MSSSDRWPQRVDDLNTVKVFFVVGHHCASVGQGDGGNDHVERATRSALRFALRHEARPD